MDQLAELAKSKGATVGQLCLAWLLAQGKDIFPIPGTTKVSRLEENVGSMKIEVSRKKRRGCVRLLDSCMLRGSMRRLGFFLWIRRRCRSDADETKVP